MLEEKFLDVYTKFKLFFYQTIFAHFEDREASLTTVETFCMEAIQALQEPTINEFANFMRISSPNAAYKVNSLIKKGYVEKIRSESDRREYHLRPTQKYTDYYNINNNYIHTVLQRLKGRISPEDCDKLEEILTLINDELMPEVPLPKRS
jgi:DNA-binding MarR family transcriptional regulator